MRKSILRGYMSASLRSRRNSLLYSALSTYYSGLRGAVGIALALSLDSEVRQAAEENDAPDEEIYITDTTKVFGIVGGIALLTLVINGTLSGPLLVKLGLTRSSATRVKLLEDLNRNIRQHVMDEFVKLLAEFRFKDVDYSVIKAHAHSVDFLLQDMTLEELKAAVRRNSHIASPNLDNVLPYFSKGDIEVSSSDLSWALYGDEMNNRKIGPP